MKPAKPHPTVAPQRADPAAILDELTALRADLVRAPALSRSRLAHVHPNFRASARNLLHYLALRRHDLRPLQVKLAALGLSSLGRAESHVLDTIDAVLAILAPLAGRRPAVRRKTTEPAVDLAGGERLLAEHTRALLGPAPSERSVRIMVTMPGEAADDPALIERLLEQGMDCMRINCAHDDVDAWLSMVKNLRRAEQATGRRCRVIMDLAGPKLRTGPVQPGPAVVRVRPRRDALGRVERAAEVGLFADDSPPPFGFDVQLPMPRSWLSGVGKGDTIHLIDARGATRTWRVVEAAPGLIRAAADKTAYITSGTQLRQRSAKSARGGRSAFVGALPNLAGALRLFQDDRLIVTRDHEPGAAALRNSAGVVEAPAHIGCTLPEVFDDVRPGESIWFDDGKIGGLIEAVDADNVRVHITHAPPKGALLRGDRGINLPESNLQLAALTAQDLDNLAFMAGHADVIELSFATRARDVRQLQQQLARLGGHAPSIVLKIETRRGFENLPDMLLTAMRSPCCGVMIARGDLAVEHGFERLAEVQEEILWICEAAHVPVIWATQVLETLAKDGMPSRAEITDAAMGHRAECVMLNKGPHVVTAVRVLDNILRRMQSHQAKKRAMLRELHLAHTLAPG